MVPILTPIPFNNINYNLIPGVVYTWPEVASVGQTEEELKEAGISFNKGTFPFSANSRARTTGDFEGMIKEGEALADLHPQIVVKVPMIKEGLKAIAYFTEQGIRTNCTLVFSVGQALLAAKAGATYVSPFIGRLDDISTDGLVLIEDIRTVYDNYEYETQILAASVRHTMHIVECAKIGADVMTGPLKAIEGLLKHPLTDSGLEKFLADYAKGNS